MSRDREAPEIGRFLRRQFAAMRGRVAAGDLDALRVMVELQEALRLQTDLAYVAAADYGYDHPTIAGELGIRKQAVQQRIAKVRRSVLSSVAPARARLSA